MPAYIGSFVHKGVRYFLEHSSISDAPNTCAMTEEEFTNWYLDASEKREEFARAELAPRMARATDSGSSGMPLESFTELILCNRAGQNEKKLSPEEYKQHVLRMREQYGLPRVE